MFFMCLLGHAFLIGEHFGLSWAHARYLFFEHLGIGYQRSANLYFS